MLEYNSMHRKLILTVLTFIFGLTICGTVSAADFEQNYTLDSDFDEGSLVGLEHNNTHNQLQLSNGSQSALPYIWVPNSNEGTVSKVNTLTGMEIARYRTGPQSSTNPSRTTVDLEGNCWLGNRQTGTAIKIGLLENNCYIDRNQRTLTTIGNCIPGPHRKVLTFHGSAGHIALLEHLVCKPVLGSLPKVDAR